MSKTVEKRNSLEIFIREQVLGPGINGYRYVDLENEFLMSKKLNAEKAIDYTNEILDIVPAAIYSTGILFPEDASGTVTEGIILDNNEQIEKRDAADEEDIQNNSEDDIETSDTVELNQMFPRTMGLTCCLDEASMEDGTVEFKVSLRYYKKLKQDKQSRFNDKYGLLCELDKEVLQKFLIQNQFNQFKLKVINENVFLLLSKITAEEFALLKSKISTIQKNASKQLFDETAGVITIPRLNRDHCFLSNLKSSIYYELKNTVTNEDVRLKLYAITQQIELLENITDHLRNLLDVNSGGYGLWQSELVERHVRIENIDFPKNQKKKSYLCNKPGDYQENISVINNREIEGIGLKHIFKFDLDDKKNDFASLSANVQLSRDSRKENNKVFVKVQLVNTSAPFDEAKQDDNRYYSTFNELVNQKSFFGVNLSISNMGIVPYSDYNYNKSNGVYDEDTTTKFIYDQFKDFGIGHGCSVKWNISESSKKVETEYLPVCETPDIEPIPRDKSKAAVFDHVEHYFDAPLFIDNRRTQEFKWLSNFSEASDVDVIRGLINFVDSYSDWIKIKRAESKYENQFKDIAKQELDKCEKDYLRMKNNVVTFLSGDNNRENLSAFRLMNGAMFMQLWHSVKVKQNEISSIIDQNTFTHFDFNFYKFHADDKLFSKTEPASWRAFQLAFILLNLDGILKLDEDLLWEHRNNFVDLVWFPTGGGKTEAYLGLIALTIINRRKLFKEQGGGTAAIMRYTLRLLTMQQFQRATLVIMAMELIRRWGNYDLGEEPITIGLWVGKNSIPNSNVDLIYEYEKKLNLKKENKIPFSNCPWCNSGIKGETIEDNEKTTSIFNKNRVHLKCSNNKCSFSFGIGRINKKRSDQGPLPVCLSDETIYQHPPSLLFGTVDKFAQLAHKVNGTNGGRNSDSRRIFGKGNWEAGKPENGYVPPDLIIQDELHLLLGPLGSAVALFESAIDQLCTREDGTRPKIISSTATTRNTQLQIVALFDRQVNLFPKPGVECDDSFFTFYRRKYDNKQKENELYLSKRKYMGVLPTGRTQIWMQMRLAAIIMTHRAIFELKELGANNPIDFNCYTDFEKAIDYYHTTISYFNSLKEVGKTQSQVQSYILKELRRVFSRVLRPQKLMHCLYTYGPIQESELTGRLSGEEVKNELKGVETRWSARKRFANLENGELMRGKIPPEFVVATNMISVGIDVSRFNTIIMNSMPRNTAEYIQASSRVARNDYGLVLTVHHPFRARDISHYEKFIEFHEKMYSYVEPISITPFTKKAVERYMGLYLATMLRHHMERFVERDSAMEISDMSDFELNQIVQELTLYFVQRKARLSKFDKMIENLIKDENISQIRNWIGDAFNDWKTESNRLISEEKDLVFNNKSAKSKRPQEQLYVDIEEYDNQIHSKKWQVPMSLRVIEPEAAIKINPL